MISFGVTRHPVWPENSALASVKLMRKNAAASPKLWQLVKPRPWNHSSCVAYPHAQWFQFEMLNSLWGTFERTRFSCSNPCTFTVASPRRQLWWTGTTPDSSVHGNVGELSLRF